MPMARSAVRDPELPANGRRSRVKGPWRRVTKPGLAVTGEWSPSRVPDYRHEVTVQGSPVTGSRSPVPEGLVTSLG